LPHVYPFLSGRATFKQFKLIVIKGSAIPRPQVFWYIAVKAHKVAIHTLYCVYHGLVPYVSFATFFNKPLINYRKVAAFIFVDK
jgi:hypothetical protein